MRIQRVTSKQRNVQLLAVLAVMALSTVGLTGCSPDTEKAYKICVATTAPAGSSDADRVAAERYCDLERKTDPEGFNAEWLYG